MSDFEPSARQPRRRKLSEEDIQLWRQVAQTIERRAGVILPDALPKNSAAKSSLPKPQPAPLRRATAEPYSPPVSAPRAEAPPLAPLERRLKQRLLRGRASFDEVLDLHGLRQDEAHRNLRHFLIGAQARGARVVLVVTGKGKSALHKEPAERETGVLRRSVPHWLRTPDIQPLVIGFEQAGAVHGGTGALYIRLRRHDRFA